MDSYLRTVPRVGIAALNPDASPVGVLAHSREVGFRSRRIHPAPGVGAACPFAFIDSGRWAAGVCFPESETVLGMFRTSSVRGPMNMNPSDFRHGLGGWHGAIVWAWLLAGSLGGQEPTGGPPKRELGPGPWDNDVLVHRIDAGGAREKLATFDRAGVASVARMADGRLLAAFQYFPKDEPRRFDRVAVRFSGDDGRNWSPAETILIGGFPAGMTRPFDPTLVPLLDGRIRLYFTSNTSRDFRRSPPMIHSAVTTNGVDYVFEPGVRFSVEGRIVIDCAVALHEGVFHLVVPDNGPVDEFSQGPRSGSPPGGTGGYHAISTDGLEFERVADLRLDSPRNRWLGCLVSDAGRLLFFGTGPGPWPIASPDGASWKPAKEAVRFPGADPGAVRLKDGSWLVVATGAPQGRGDFRGGRRGGPEPGKPKDREDGPRAPSQGRPRGAEHGDDTATTGR